MQSVLIHTLWGHDRLFGTTDVTVVVQRAVVWSVGKGLGLILVCLGGFLEARVELRLRPGYLVQK